MSKYTPGPWKVHNSIRTCVTFISNEGEENLFTETIDGYYACQNEADAHLISAAPELLEALEPFAKFACDKECKCFNCMARIAVNKAKGETNVMS